MGAKVEDLTFAIQSMRKGLNQTGMLMADALEKAAHVLLNASQKLVPVDTGELKKSGKVVVKGRGFSAVAYVIYEARYAVWVHENLQSYHEPPTQARYLADAVPKVRGTIAAMLKKQALLIGRKRGGI